MYATGIADAPFSPEHHGSGPRLMRADTLMGNDVYNPGGDDLGDVKEIMFDMHSVRVNYALVSFSGFLGMGEKLFAVPWSALKLDTVNKRFTLDIDKSRLENAPGSNQDAWPDMADAAWAKGIHSYYGTQQYPDEIRLSTRSSNSSGVDSFFIFSPPNSCVAQKAAKR